MGRLFFVLVLTAALAGCDSNGSRGHYDVVPGYVVFYGDTSTVDLSASAVGVGEPIAVTVATFGGGCTSKAGTEVEVRGLEAVVTALDSVYVPGPKEACTAELRRFPRTVTVRFAEAGTGVVRVRGRSAPGDDPTEVVARVAVQ